MCKGTFSILWLKKLSLTSWRNSTHPYSLTAISSCFSSYHHLKLSNVSFVYLVTTCLPLYENWNFLSQCGLYLSAPQTAPSTWKGLRTTTKGRKGGKNTGRKVFTWASTICSMYLNSFHLPKSRDIHYWFCLYIQGPSLRMLSDLSQGHSAQTSMLMLTR